MNQLYRIDGVDVALCQAHSSEEALLKRGAAHIIHVMEGEDIGPCAECEAQTEYRSTWAIDIRVVEHVEAVGPVAEIGDCMKYLWKNGFNITYKGLFTSPAIHPKVDESRFLLRAEKDTTPRRPRT